MPLKKKKKPVKKALKRKPVRKSTKKKIVKKIAKRAVKRAAIKKPKEAILGLVTHFFPKVCAAVIKLKASLNVGDTIKVKGHTSDFTQAITSMQVDHVPINSAKKGQEIGILVNSRVRRHDKVYKA